MLENRLTILTTYKKEKKRRGKEREGRAGGRREINGNWGDVCVYSLGCGGYFPMCTYIKSHNHTP